MNSWPTNQFECERCGGSLYLYMNLSYMFCILQQQTQGMILNNPVGQPFMQATGQPHIQPPTNVPNTQTMMISNQMGSVPPNFTVAQDCLSITAGPAQAATVVSSTGYFYNRLCAIRFAFTAVRKPQFSGCRNDGRFRNDPPKTSWTSTSSQSFKS